MIEQSAPQRPPMDPSTGVRRIKLAPHELVRRVTPAEDLFVLAHLGIPRVDPEHWSLRVDGRMCRPATFSYAELTARPKKIVEAAHQCCGSPLEPTVPTRRVSNVRWGGVDLAALLAELGMDPSARFVWSYGLDGGRFGDTAWDWFVKDLPLERLRAGDVLLAYELNEAPLPAEHGFPLRLVVPGFYGTNSVKWLWRLELAAERHRGLFTTQLYSDRVAAEDLAAGQPPARPVWAVAPESVIVAPAPESVLPLDRPTEIWGWAWSFRGVAAVEISVDAGASFSRAALEERRGWAWQRFSLHWRPAAPGETLISARAFDANGSSQPEAGARNAMHTVRVLVRA